MDAFSDVFITTLKNINDVCQKINLFNFFWANFHNNYMFSIVVNDSLSVTSPCLKREPIFAAFTPEFTVSDDSDSDEESITKKKRKSYLVLNINIIQKLFEQYQAELMTSSGGETGLFYVSTTGQSSDTRRVTKQLYKLIIMLTMHALGHIDLFMKYGYCFYESHKKVSQFQSLSTIFRIKNNMKQMCK